MNDKRTAARIPALAPELAAEFAAASAPATLAPDRQMAIRQRLLARLRRDPPHFVTVRRDDGVWQSLAPDIAMKVLDCDDSMRAFLLPPSDPHRRYDPYFAASGLSVPAALRCA
jgi:hypothetical protein